MILNWNTFSECPQFPQNPSIFFYLANFTCLDFTCLALYRLELVSPALQSGRVLQPSLWPSRENRSSTSSFLDNSKSLDPRVITIHQEEGVPLSSSACGSQCRKPPCFTYNFRWLGIRATGMSHSGCTFEQGTNQMKFVLLPRTKSKQWKKRTEGRTRRTSRHLGHSYRAGIQFRNALVSLIAAFPHAIILRGQKAGVRAGRRGTWAVLWRNDSFMLLQTSWTHGCLFSETPRCMVLHTQAVFLWFQFIWPSCSFRSKHSGGTKNACKSTLTFLIPQNY